MMSPQTAETHVLAIECVECGAVAEATAHGWKAYVGGGFEEEPLEVVVFCPVCAVREFDDG
jgi:hypothetical protein